MWILDGMEVAMPNFCWKDRIFWDTFAPFWAGGWHGFYEHPKIQFLMQNGENNSYVIKEFAGVIF